MKSLLAALVLLSSSYAFSCPQLAGEYSCQFAGDPAQLRVEQRVLSNVQIYKVIFQGLEQEFVTDGQPRSVTRDGEMITYTAQCKDNLVVANLKTESDGAVMMTRITVKQTPSKDVVLSYEIIDSASSETSMTEEIQCKRVR